MRPSRPLLPIATLAFAASLFGGAAAFAEETVPEPNLPACSLLRRE